MTSTPVTQPIIDPESLMRLTWRMRQTRRALSLALALTVTAVVAVTVNSGVSAAAVPDTVRWGPCPERGAAPRLECSTLEVPLDYRDPGGRQIEIAVSRLVSEEPSRRRGVLLTNPGGPGITALGWPAVLAESGLPKAVLDSYDVIGFDPRGVARSTPVACDLTPEQQARGNFPTYAHSAAEPSQ
jgi:hypothetical protein